MKKKFILFAILFNTAIFSLFAVPGAKSFIPDQSGDYVYYKDETFDRESYIGILYYDEATYQIKYYAPNDSVNHLVEKEISILITVNPEVDYWEMTGEKIISTIMPDTDDVDIVNYLHDILYEFAARRSKVDLAASSIENEEEYNQFGGNVTICYNPIIPLFNIMDIIPTDTTKEPVKFFCCTFGTLKDSNDKAFDNFKGIPDSTILKTNTQKAKKAKKKVFYFNGRSITLDSKWDQVMDNVWLYGNDAIATISQIPSVSLNAEYNMNYVIRRILGSLDNAYKNLTNCTYEAQDNGNIVLTLEIYQPVEQRWVVNYEVLTQNIQGGFDCLILTAYKDSYYAKWNYYHNIIKSYK